MRAGRGHATRKKMLLGVSGEMSWSQDGALAAQCNVDASSTFNAKARALTKVAGQFFVHGATR